MLNKHILPEQCTEILPPDSVAELLDSLYELLHDAQDFPLLKVKIGRLIRWVEAHISPGEDEEDQTSTADSEYNADFALLIEQAQLQTQQ